MSKQPKKEKKSFFDMASVDIFGEPVQLKFDGKGTYATKLGGAVSVLFFIQIFYLLAVKMRALIVGQPGQLTT